MRPVPCFAPTVILPNRRNLLFRSVCSRRSTVRPICCLGGSQAALILDCDGVIVESEELHRQAYNACWEWAGLGFSWSESFYGKLQNSIGGGKEKMAWYFDQNSWPRNATTEAERAQILYDLHKKKTDIYIDRISSGVPARPGVVRLIDEAFALGIPVVVASAANRDAVHRVLRATLGETRVSKFNFVLAGDDVREKKPDPTIYETAVRRLGVPKMSCVVIEDSLIGVQAAVEAGLPVVVTYTEYTKNQDFSAARAVYPSFGEPDEDGGGDFVTVETLFPALATVRS